MLSRSLLRRSSRFAMFVWVTLGAGLAIALVAATLLRLESAWPVALRPVLEPTAIPDTTWAMPWTAAAWTAADTQRAGTNALTGVLLALAAAAVLMALVNVSTLASERSIGRRRERAVRAAVGAGPGRFLMERLVENAWIYGIAVAMAVVAALGLAVIVKAMWPAGLEPVRNPALASAGAILCIACIVLLGGTLLARGPRDLRGMLAGGSATEDRSAGAGRGATVVVEVALAMALACVTVLLVRHGRTGDQSGTPVDNDMVTLDIQSALQQPEARAAAFAALLDHVHELPGVEAESIASPGAWLGMGTRDRVLAECDGCVRAQMLMPFVPAFPVHQAVSPGYFTAFGIRVIAGRTFERSDVWDTTRVAVINEAFASTGFGRGGPLGKKLQIGGIDGEWFTIVGIVADARAIGLGAPRDNAPVLYLSTFQQPPSIIGLAARTAAPPADFEDAVQAFNDRTSTGEIATAEPLIDRVDRAVAPLRWFGRLFAGLAAFAFAFAVHGVLVAVRATTRARRRELAVRAAVGAGPLRILGLVIGRTAGTVAVGLGLGLFLAGLAGRVIQLEIGGLPPLDLAAAGPIAAIIAIAAIAGALCPGLRAARASPAHVFRE